MRLLRKLVSALLLGAFLWLLVLLSIFLFARRNEANPADAIVVLGAAQYDGRPSPVLRARLDHAVALFDSGFAPRLILTGGVGVGDTVSEAEVSRRYAVRQGVPDERILTEQGGLSSGESMSEVVRLMEQHDLGSAILVSDPFHMLRLRLLALRHGMRAYSSPTRTSPISMDSAEEWRHILRESLILPSVLFDDRLIRFGPASASDP